MKAGMFFLVTAYVLSQFYRAFLAVLSPVLEAEIGAGPEDLAIASGLWFVSFAAMQIPIGWALDSIGPRRTACGLLALGGGGGAVVMALAQGPAAIWVAMVLIGIGCAPVLMASYYILARNYPPVVFATLAGVIVGVGSLGNIAAALPTAWAVEAFGWRQTLWGLAAITLVTAAAIALVGALILLRPGPDSFQPAALLALGAAVLLGIEVIFIKQLSGREPWPQVLLVNNAIGLGIATLAVLPVWVPWSSRLWQPPATHSCDGPKRRVRVGRETALRKSRRKLSPRYPLVKDCLPHSRLGRRQGAGTR